MVSPSKSQHQEQKHPPRKTNLQSHSQLHIQNSEKPLEKKSFYLDIKNHATAAKIEAKIRDLGGAIELFLVRSVSLVASDRVDKTGYVNPNKRKWGCASGGSGGIPSLRSLETPTPMSTTQTPFFSSECPLSNSTNLRGQTAQRSKSRVDAMLERALIQPQQCSVDPLDNAQNWGIPIWAIDKLQAWLDKIYASFKEADHLKRLKQSRRRIATADLKVRHLKGPYIKFESFHRSTRPVFVELPAWPTLNINGDPGSCPFNTKRRETPGKSVQKEVKENREGIRAVKQEEAQEMTRRPRTTAARVRRTEQLASGYCEICRVSYRDLTKHVQTDQHVSFVRNEDNFLSLDTLINAGADVEAFLKLNRTKDIEKDCNLFPNGDRELHDIVLPEGKDGKSTKSLEDFSVGDIKMVQCNGARRNLNLKLSSPHNLRARAKHESGHLLRSKGSPWHEVDKTEKFYDKFEGFTIKKRAKGTIWIEEDEPGVEFTEKHELKESKEDFKIKSFSNEIEERCYSEKGNNVACNKNTEGQGLQQSLIHGNEQNGISNVNHNETNHHGVERRVSEQINGSINNGCIEDSLRLNDSNGIESCKFVKRESCKDFTCNLSAESVPLNTTKSPKECERVNSNVIDVCNGHTVKETKDDEKSNNKTSQQGVERIEVKEEKLKCSRSGRRGGRGIRGRHRLSVEERLIEDNRAYYKVEVLGSKLRSSVLPQGNPQCPASKGDVNDEEKKEEVPSSEKPVVVRFKRVRKSELSLLSDEAESFMFGEPRRDDSSETSDGEQSSVLPKDTESDYNDTLNDVCPSSPLISSCSIKSEIIEEDSQDSICSGRTRKRRRTQAEALIKDNVDYYKFETPGSRLRYQAPLTGIKEFLATEQTEKPGEPEEKSHDDTAEKIYPSKPSAEVEKMQFSFEAVPKSEPWYQTYQRQDEGAEFWHYFSEGDSRKPFLLPYEIENFHEHLTKTQNRLESKRKGRGRSAGCVGRSPRKSPRCHASTLAIMSTIIRKREQQQQQHQQQQYSTNLYTIEECQSTRSQGDIPRPEQKHEAKSDVDEELKDMAKTIDDMLNANDGLELDNSFEPDPAPVESNSFEPNVPKGPPCNLIELLENCHDIINCLENSSCASSECGEGNTESPMKRRKKRKNRTGWPGIKMKKKLRSKSPVDTSRERDSFAKIEIPQGERLQVQLPDTSSRLSETCTNGRATMSVVGAGLQDEEQLQASFTQRKDEERVLQTCPPVSSSIVCHENNGKRVESSTEISDRPVFQPSNVEECADSTVSEHRNETDKNSLLTKDYEFRKSLTAIEEMSEGYLDNDENHEDHENHENVFRNDVNSLSIAERRFISKTSTKKRPRGNTSSDPCEPDGENHDILCRKDTETVIVARKHHNTNGLARKRQQKDSEIPDSEMERHGNVYRRNRVVAKKRIYSRKCAKRSEISSDTVFEDENCKNDSYISITTCRKQQQNLKTVKRRTDGISSETQESELEYALSERVSPTIIASSELDERRSSIDYQPVVRMMKIDDQVDVDHSILSVTVASNRRLRSSSSPRSNNQPPKKRLKTSRSQFGRWLKSS